MPIANVLVGDVEVEIDGYAIGYSMDGAQMTVRSSFADIKVEEINGTIIRKLVDQEVTVTLTMAEATISNLFYAIPGSEMTSATLLTLGGEDLQDFELILTGAKPGPVAGGRIITLPHVNPTGEVGIPFKKGEVSVVPVTFSVLCDGNGVFGDIDDS